MSIAAKNVIFAALFANAEAAGKEAAAKCAVAPMVVQDADVLSGAPSPGGKQYFVADGVCGFAWVRVKPGNCGFAKWLVANGKARKSYQGGVSIWISDYNQSMQRKESHAYAMADVINAAGVKAYGESRMD